MSKGASGTEWRLGGVGLACPEWVGGFYPEGMRSGDFLEYYAKHFDAVELDTTVYGVPPLERVERWAAATPDGFRFCAKTPRLVTHELGLDRAAGPMAE